MVSGCSHATMAELSSCKKGYLALYRIILPSFVLESHVTLMHQNNARLHLTPHPCLLLSLLFCFLLCLTDYIQISASGSASWQENLASVVTFFLIFLCYFFCICIGFKGVAQQVVPPRLSFGLDILLRKRWRSSSLHPQLLFYYFNRVSASAWNCICYSDLRVTCYYYFLCIYNS